MWEQWMSCPVAFPDTQETWDGHYDRKNDIILINLNKVTTNSVLVYLWCLLYRSHGEARTKEWVSGQALLMWSTMTVEEKLALGKMLFDRVVP